MCVGQHIISRTLTPPRVCDSLRSRPLAPSLFHFFMVGSDVSLVGARLSLIGFNA